VEGYFRTELKRSTLKRFDEVSDDVWIDFAKTYKAAMTADFGDAFIARSPTNDADVRLYFEPIWRDDWEQAISGRFHPTPLLGRSPYPTSGGTVDRAQVSMLLDPLKKHLLTAHAVYVVDSFYWCFDGLADYDLSERATEPNLTQLVSDSVRSIKQWLPILVELRELIESGALVFTPYSITPSFPYSGIAPRLEQYEKKLRLVGPVDEPIDAREFDKVAGAWLNARLLHLDPVLPTTRSLQLAAALRLEGDPLDVTAEPVTFEIRAFRDPKEIGLDALVKMRKNDEVFARIREVASECKTAVEEIVASDATPERVSQYCRWFISDHLARYEEKSVLRFMDEHPVAGVAVSIAVGAALAPAGAMIGGPAGAVAGIIGGAVLTPKMARAVKGRFDPKRRAYGHLHALV
jgi:hypothetical protein